MSTVARHENRVFTNHNPSSPHARSWTCRSPVAWRVRVTKHESCSSGGSQRAASAAWFWNTITSARVPIVSRRPSNAMPIGVSSVRKCEFSPSPVCRSRMSRPAWYVVTAIDDPVAERSVANELVWLEPKSSRTSGAGSPDGRATGAAVDCAARTGAVRGAAPNTSRARAAVGSAAARCGASSAEFRRHLSGCGESRVWRDSGRGSERSSSQSRSRNAQSCAISARGSVARRS